MATTQAVRRLQKELIDIKKNPIPQIEALPDDKNILVWYFVIDGPPDTFYEGGEYMGRIQFPPDYPFKAPSIYMITPNGRFETEKSICMSMTAYHQDLWSPMWNTGKIIQGLVSFMLEPGKAIGTMESDEKTRKMLAKKSREFNVRHQKYGVLFPKRLEDALAAMIRADEGKDFLVTNKRSFPSMVLPILDKILMNSSVNLGSSMREGEKEKEEKIEKK